MTAEDRRSSDRTVGGKRGDPPSRASREAFGEYGPGSVAWRLNREATLLLAAGPRALLLQLAHPLVAEGVEQHSSFRAEPWRRLEGTLRSYLRIVYGAPRSGRAEIDRLERLHAAVKGPVRDPVARSLGADRYAARDPELSLWVHATLIDSTIVAYEAWIEPLTVDERRRFYEETRPVGLAFGIPKELLPADYDAFEADLAAMLGPEGPIVVSPTARELSRTILHPPLGELAPLAPLSRALDAIPTRLYDWLMWPAVGLLPATIREQYEIPWTPWRRVVAGWVTEGFRFWRPTLPAGVRQMPQALAADRRLRPTTARSGRPDEVAQTNGDGRGGGAQHRR